MPNKKNDSADKCCDKLFFHGKIVLNLNNWAKVKIFVSKQKVLSSKFQNEADDAGLKPLEPVRKISTPAAHGRNKFQNAKGISGLKPFPGFKPFSF